MVNQNSFTICIDSNFIVRLLVGYYEETIYLEMWTEWRNANTKIIAPDLINYEITNVLWRLSKTNQINYTQAKIALTESFNLGIELHSHSELHQDALAIAEKFQLPAAYDAHYLALAEKMQIDFYTCDKKMFNSVHQNFPRIKLVTSNSS
jgi:predicted nucleic acid-binding protein